MAITVYFVGICTHLWWDEEHPRVVLVNGKDAREIQNQHIGSHVPTLRIAASDIISESDPWTFPGTRNAIVEWQLDGARISIVNGTSGPCRRHPSFHNCMPRLNSYIEPREIGAPSQDAVEGRDARLTSSIFDLTCGEMAAGALKKTGAVFGRLRAETAEAPRLQIAPYGSGEPRVITLRDGAEITISNLGATEGHDGSSDFFLHYTLAAEMPDPLGAPVETPAGCPPPNTFASTWPPGFTTVDAGCSNSAYP